MKYRYYYILLLDAMLSHFILYAPYELNKNILKGTFVAIFIALILACINAYVTIYVFNAFKNYSIVEINKALMGRAIGGFFSFAYIIANLTVSFFMFRGVVEIVWKFMLPATPVWLIAILVLLLPCTNLLNDNKGFLRFMGFISIFILFWSFLQIALTVKEVHPYYVKGGILHSLQVPNIRAITAAGFYFSGVSHLALFNPLFGWINWKKTCLLFSTAGLVVALSSIYIPEGIWGPIILQRLQLTAISSADTVLVDLFFIERVLYILMPLYFLLGATDFLAFGRVGYGLIKIMLPNKKLQFTVTSIILLLYVILSSMIKDTEFLLNAGSLVISLALIGHYTISTFLFILTKLKAGRSQ